MLFLTIFHRFHVFFFFCFPGAIKRCFQCRSRGDLGSCKDQFTFNATTATQDQGVEAIPCASGWCGKVIEGTGSYKQDGENMPYCFRLDLLNLC